MHGSVRGAVKHSQLSVLLARRKTDCLGFPGPFMILLICYYVSNISIFDSHMATV